METPPTLMINVFDEVKVTDVVLMVEVKTPYVAFFEYSVPANSMTVSPYFFPPASTTLAWPPLMARAPSTNHYQANQTATYGV